MSLIPSGQRRNPSYLDWLENVYEAGTRAYNIYNRNRDRDDDNPRPRQRQRRGTHNYSDMPPPPMRRTHVGVGGVPNSIRMYTKRLLNRKIETKKRAIQINDTTMNYVTWYYTDPLQFISIGTGRNQRISDKISDVYLKYTVAYYHLNNTQWEASWLRVLIIASDKELPVDVATPAYASTPGNGGNFNFLLSNDFHQSIGIVDRNDYTVLYDKRIKSQRNVGLTTASPAVLRINKKLASEAVYAENTTGGVQFQKKKNIYLLFGVSNRGATVTDVAGALQSSGFIYYKDG